MHSLKCDVIVINRNAVFYTKFNGNHKNIVCKQHIIYELGYLDT